MPESMLTPGQGAEEPCNEAGDVVYSALQRNGMVTLRARGMHPTSGFEVALRDTPIAVFPPEFALVHHRPTGPVAQVVTPFAVSAGFPSSEAVRVVAVHDAGGRNEVLVEAPGTEAPEAIFEGTSDRGDLAEALQLAISAAKDGLTAERIAWSLTGVSGVSGGFVPEERLTVAIQAHVP